MHQNHSMDACVCEYHKKLGELQDVERQLKDLEPLRERKALISKELDALREKIHSHSPHAPKTDTAAIAS